MDEDALRELLRSPLEETSPGRAGRGTQVLSFLAAAAVGAALTMAGVTLASGGAPPTTTAAPSTTAPVASGPALPPGYSPLGEGYGARVERILQRPDGVFVTISMAVDDAHDPAETMGHQGGQWELGFPDGTAVRSVAVILDPIARGTATIAFPAFDHAAAEATALRLVAADEVTTATLSTTAPGAVAALAAEGTVAVSLDPADLELGGGATLHLDSLALGRGWGTLEWSVTGGVTAAVQPAVVLEGGGDTPVLLVSFDPSLLFRSRLLSIPLPTLTAGGSAALSVLDYTHPDPGPDFTVAVSLQVTWAVSRPADAVLPMGPSVVIVAIGGA